MSLIGSLEDLGLGDILQIISLSQKSGILAIHGEDGEGSIVLRDGLVRGAVIKGGPEDLRGVLVGGRFLEPDEFDGAGELARSDGTTIEEAIAAQTSMTLERIDALRTECVEAAVMAMFSWRTGEFSFDVRSTDADSDEDLPLFLPQGINAQYLAMEGTRIEDESAHIRSEWQEETRGGGDPESSGEAVIDFGMVDDEPELALLPEDEAAPSVAEAIGLATAEQIDRDQGEDALPAAELAVEADGECEEDHLEADEGYAFAEPLDPEEPLELHDALEVDAVAEPEARVEDAAAEAAPASLPSLPNAPLVVIDPDLVALEWMKRTLKDAFPRIHIFQRWDLGLNPIRQYLARATRPVVLLHPDAAGDPLSGIRSGADFVSRLKTQQPRLPVIWLKDFEGPAVEDVGDADAVLTRPSSQQLRSARAAAELGRLADELRGELATVLARNVEPPEPASSPRATRSADDVHRLKEVTDLLADASMRGEALPLAIRFASEIFDRVAMFMVRRETVTGMAQRGLPAGGGPDDEGLRKVELSREGCAWFRQVLAAGRSLRTGPSDGGDYTLAALLGHAAPSEAYLAPIESSGEVVALLYADNLPSQRPLGDSEALEVVLHHVGLALERAVLERALAEAHGDQEA